MAMPSASKGYHYSDGSGNWQRDWQPFLMWLHMADGKFLNDDLTTCALDQQEALDALEFLIALVHEHEVTSYPGLEPQGDLNVLAGRNAAMQLSSADMERVVNLYAPDEIEAIQPALPMTGKVQATAFLGEQVLHLVADAPTPPPPGASCAS